MSDKKVRVSEIRMHTFGGTFPEVETYPHVDTALLLKGDDDPVYVTLPIAEIGRVSMNRLVYDEALVSAIEAQLPGKGGIRGHVGDHEIETAFPVDAVYWIGHKRVNETLWARGYIPPGETREDVRRKKATGGGLSTSIFGQAVREMTDTKKQTWRAKEFELQSLDLAPNARASLKLGGDFALTRETTQDNEEGNSMNIEIANIADVPQTVREQIISQYELEGKAGRVAELTTQVSELSAQVAELATYRTIVTEIRQTLGSEANTLETVKGHFETITKLAEMLGVPYTNITVRIEEMHEQVAELAKNRFAEMVGNEIAELTPWSVKNADAQKKVDSFRKGLRRVVIAELAGKTDAESVKTVTQRIWDEEFSDLAQPLIAELAGPGAVVKPIVRPNGGAAPKQTDAEMVAEVKSKWSLG